MQVIHVKDIKNELLQHSSMNISFKSLTISPQFQCLIMLS